MSKQILLEQFSACYDENGWFVAIKNALSGVTAEQAAWKPAGTDNSIWETLAHVAFYNYAYLQRFKGVEYEYSTDDNDETFAMPEQISDEKWTTTVDRFVKMMNEFRDLLRASGEAKFDEPVPTRPDTKWREIISSINAHNAYHGGQILLLRKLQRSWNPEKGVS